jgi:hypothetical protein
MSDSLSPRRYEQRGGIPSRADALAEDLNRLSDAAIQHISVVGGTVRRFGNSVCIEVPQQKSESFPKPVVITNCITGTPGVVKIKLSTGPGSTTAKPGAVEEYAWIGTDAFSTTGMALWADRINEKVGTLTVKWLIRDAIIGAAHWTAPASGDLASTQDNPAAATLCDG